VRARVAVEDLDDATDGVRFKVLANVSTLIHKVTSAMMKDIVSFAGMDVLKPIVTAFALDDAGNGADVDIAKMGETLLEQQLFRAADADQSASGSATLKQLAAKFEAVKVYNTLLKKLGFDMPLQIVGRSDTTDTQEAFGTITIHMGILPSAIPLGRVALALAEVEKAKQKFPPELDIMEDLRQTSMKEYAKKAAEAQALFQQFETDNMRLSCLSKQVEAVHAQLSSPVGDLGNSVVKTLADIVRSNVLKTFKPMLENAEFTELDKAVDEMTEADPQKMLKLTQSKLSKTVYRKHQKFARFRDVAQAIVTILEGHVDEPVLQTIYESDEEVADIMTNIRNRIAMGIAVQGAYRPIGDETRKKLVAVAQAEIGKVGGVGGTLTAKMSCILTNLARE